MLKNISDLGTILNKTEQQSIKAGKYGKVTCEDGTTFSANAESMDSVVQGGNRWCQDHGHGNASSYLFA